MAANYSKVTQCNLYLEEQLKNKKISRGVQYEKKAFQRDKVVTACLKIDSRDFGTSCEPLLPEKVDASVNTDFNSDINCGCFGKVLYALRSVDTLRSLRYEVNKL
jgi:hypothetical protein